MWKRTGRLFDLTLEPLMSVVLVDKYIVWAPSAFDNRRPKLKGNYSFVLHGGVPKGT